MAFNPLQEKGIPIENQIRNWSELNVQPFDKHEVDPYTRCRVITMNGIEVEAIINSHQFARHTADLDLKRQLALTRRVEQQQQKAVNWLLPGSASVLETTIAYEQVAVDLTAWVAQNEPDPYFRQCYEFGLLEDFDHLYRYANLMEMIEAKNAKAIVKDLTEIIPGRPTRFHHRHPFDMIRKPIDRHTADFRSSMHALTITAAEQQTMNYYMNAGVIPEHPLARALYLEIAQVEEEHVTHYESMLDPTMSWAENLVLHEYNECYMYYSFMQTETDSRIRQVWELHLAMEIEHLRIACELMKKLEGRDPAETLLPPAMPETVTFEPNKQYVRQVLESQVDLIPDGTEFVRIGDLPPDHRFHAYQQRVNGDFVPSDEVIEEIVAIRTEDYRLETEGPAPVEGLRRKA